MKRRFLHQHGFSLVELMAILVILAVCTTLALPGFASSLRRHRFRKNTQEMMARLRGFKLKAVSTGKGVTISFSDQQIHVLIQGEEEYSQEIPFDTDMKMETNPSQLYFSPQGWARPAMIRLQQRKRTQMIGIDPLTARPYQLQQGSGQE